MTHLYVKASDVGVTLASGDGNLVTIPWRSAEKAAVDLTNLAMMAGGRACMESVDGLPVIMSGASLHVGDAAHAFDSVELATAAHEIARAVRT